MDDTKDIGSLIIEEQKHLQEFSSPELRYYANTIRAGQIGRILGKLRKQEVITNFDKIDVFAADVGIIDSKVLLSLFIPELASLGAIDVYQDGSGAIVKIEENIGSEEDILRMTGEYWLKNSPNEEEYLSLDAIKLCSQIPRLKTELDQELLAVGYKNLDFGLALSKNFSLVQEYEIPGIKEPVYHTPYYAREHTTSIIHTLRGLDKETRISIENLLNLVGKNQATPVSKIKFVDSEALACIQRTGLIDVTQVETTQGNSERFLFTPAIWSPFGPPLMNDEQEHVRALLSCVKFGQISPSKIDGRQISIRMPEKLMAALLRNRRVGPASPIGTDYFVLEKEGIVNIEESPIKGRYNMILVKDDVADRALRILTHGRNDSLGEESTNTNSLVQQSNFENTVQERVKIDTTLKRKPTKYSDTIAKKIVEEFRGGHL
jgi:hypothetical protein